LRVIAGRAKGMALTAPKGQEATRPTADRVKEALFGALQFEIRGRRVLDLFAGSGALGIEALSRGAAKAIFVEKDREAILALQINLKAARCAADAEVWEMDYLDALEKLDTPFDYIFIDPPYASGFYRPAIETIGRRGLLLRGGKILAEHDGSARFGDITEIRRKKYGKTVLSTLAWE